MTDEFGIGADLIARHHQCYELRMALSEGDEDCDKSLGRAMPSVATLDRLVEAIKRDEARNELQCDFRLSAAAPRLFR